MDLERHMEISSMAPLPHLHPAGRCSSGQRHLRSERGPRFSPTHSARPDTLLISPRTSFCSSPNGTNIYPAMQGRNRGFILTISSPTPSSISKQMVTTTLVPLWKSITAGHCPYSTATGHYHLSPDWPPQSLPNPAPCCHM